MTEDEARAKWCPAVRLAIREDGNDSATWAQTNRGEDANSGACNCIASACMAWRWSYQRNGGLAVNRHGYCGLAGQPS